MHDQYKEANLYAQEVMEYCREGGTSLSQCARGLHIDHIYVIGLIHRFGLDHTFGDSVDNIMPKQIADNIVRLYDDGLDRRGIYLETGLHIKTVAAILRANNRDYRKPFGKHAKKREERAVPVYTNMLKSAIHEAIEYWKPRSPEFYRFWQEELKRVKQ